jgi:hypothetical protein
MSLCLVNLSSAHRAQRLLFNFFVVSYELIIALLVNGVKRITRQQHKFHLFTTFFAHHRVRANWTNTHIITQGKSLENCFCHGCFKLIGHGICAITLVFLDILSNCFDASGHHNIFAKSLGTTPVLKGVEVVTSMLNVIE